MNKEESEKIIAEFEVSSNGPEQLSEEWYRIRNEQITKGITRIGGSEIASLLGENPYQSQQQTLNYKSGKQERVFTGQMACWFGTMFEEVAVTTFEYMQHLTIHCKNISLVDRFITGFMYSPDGIVSLPYDNDDIYLFKDVTTENHDMDQVKDMVYYPTLIEIKCPYRRLPREMPSYYYSQLQSGFININIIKSALFVDNLFRICSRGDMTNTTRFSYQLFKTSSYISNDPLLFGYIKIYDDNEDNYIPMQDLGTMHNFRFEEIMGDIVTGMKTKKYRLEYSTIFEDADICKDSIYNDIVNYEPRYLLCWKLFDIKYTKIYPDNLQMDKIKKVVTQYVNGELT